MKLAVATLSIAAALAASTASASTTKPTCHWTHHKAGAVNVYVQKCSVQKHPRHRADRRWTHAGPGNSPAPRIG